MELSRRYFKYRKGNGGVHISYSGYERTLCAFEMKEANTANDESVLVDCFECLKVYKQETGIGLSQNPKHDGEQQTLF